MIKQIAWVLLILITYACFYICLFIACMYLLNGVMPSPVSAEQSFETKIQQHKKINNE